MHCKGYSGSLSPDLMKLYSKKLKDYDIFDPYEIPISEFEENRDMWPNIQHADIVNYLVFSTHAITLQEIKSYKSLESHNYFTSGWVNNHVLIKALPGDRALMLGEVKHSQSVRSAPLKVWLLCKSDGEIVTGHCNCMAGMGEACSHIGAFLFLIEAGVRLKNDESCTDLKNVWLKPYTKTVQYAQIKDINFESASAKFKKTITGKSSKKQKCMPSIPEPTTEELDDFYAGLNNEGLSSAILTVVEPFNQNFVRNNYMTELNNLYCTENTKLSWQELIKKCREVMNRLNITKCDAEEIEKKTKPQSRSKKWFLYRTGRVTASIMKAICNTDIDAPSKTLIKKVCYPSLANFSTSATEWGKQHEVVAKRQYIYNIEKHHCNLQISDSGLHINPSYPYIGATPDGLITCDCCGSGVFEIKCPYNSRDNSIVEISLKKGSFLISDEASNISLSRNHDYYYQVQTQLLVSNSNYCDFIVWTNKDMFIERIYPDDIIFETITEKSLLFFSFCVLPELLAKWYSKNL